MKFQYQHVVPQRDLDHEVKPAKRGKFSCAVCSKAITKVSLHDGPELLKSFFRF